MPGVALGLDPGRQGRVRAAASACASSASRRQGRRRHAVHGRVEHQGADHADAGASSSTQGSSRGSTPVTQLLPALQARRRRHHEQVLVKHLICACTGMPRQDFEWLLRVQGRRRRSGVMTLLGTMQPTSKFGELFQYSNPMAAAAGFIGGHVAYPEARARRRLRRGDAGRWSSIRSA